MNLPAELKDLQRRHPLPGGFTLEEVFGDEVEIQGIELAMRGLIARRGADGAVAIGSAAEPNGSPWARAYYELLERASLLTARDGDRARFDVVDEHGLRLGEVEHAQVFEPPDPAGGIRASLTNGVAVHASYGHAAERARMELAERDGVLAAWFDRSPIRRVSLPARPELEGLRQLYELGAYQFGDGGALGLFAAGVFGFPRAPHAPLMVGYGAGEDAPRAVEAALSEALQRLAFLWGEDIPEAAPESSPTSDFHQEFYLVPDHHDLLRGWLAQARTEPGPGRRRAPPVAATYADLTPPDLQPGLRVLRAMAPGVRALVLGRLDEWAGLPVAHERSVHPIF